MTAPDRAGSTFRTRRRRDRGIAAAIAVLVIVAGALVYLNSDIRAVDDDTGPNYNPTAAMDTVPQGLEVAWEHPTDPAIGAAASPYGTVAVTDQHGVTGLDAETGEKRWSYSRSNRDLCTVGSGDTDAGDIASSSSVRGIMAIYARNGYCGEMVLLDPRTGERRYQRTAPNHRDGSLIFGGPYAAWVSPSLLEVWRWDLLRTIQYGNQPTPDAAGTKRLGCTFTDAAVTDDQFATIEHCPDKGEQARVVLNWTDPHTQNDDWSVYRTEARAEIDTGSSVARIVGITRDRVAVLINEPTPAVIVYDADGTKVSRTPVQVPAASITTDGGLTPRVTLGEVQYSLIGSHLVAIGTTPVQVTVTVTPSSTEGGEQADSDTGGDSDGVGGLLDGSETATTESTGPSTETQERDTPELGWTMDKAIGLPTLIGGTLLVPTVEGLMVVPAEQGTVERTIAVPRAGSPARVDVSVVGDRIIELRGSNVVSLKPAP